MGGFGDGLDFAAGSCGESLGVSIASAVESDGPNKDREADVRRCL